MRGYSTIDVAAEQNDLGKSQSDKSFTGKIQNLADMTIALNNVIEYLVSL